MLDVANISMGARGYLASITRGKWSRSQFDERYKCDMLLNNLCESFNHVILDARTKGIITMNEMIRTKLMVRIQQKRDTMLRLDSTFCPKPLKKLERGRQMSWFYKAIWDGGHRYQVIGFDGQFVVEKGDMTCTCRRWQLSGIPCHHAIAAFNENNENPQSYVDDCYRVSTYLRIYSHLLAPINGKDLWPRSDHPPIIPPQAVNYRRGRKQVLRRKEDDELQRPSNTGIVNGKVSKKGNISKCSHCGKRGHNKKWHEKNGSDAPGTSRIPLGHIQSDAPTEDMSSRAPATTQDLPDEPATQESPPPAATQESPPAPTQEPDVPNDTARKAASPLDEVVVRKTKRLVDITSTAAPNPTLSEIQRSAGKRHQKGKGHKRNIKPTKQGEIPSVKEVAKAQKPTTQKLHVKRNLNSTFSSSAASTSNIPEKPDLSKLPAPDLSSHNSSFKAPRQAKTPSAPKAPAAPSASTASKAPAGPSASTASKAHAASKGPAATKVTAAIKRRKIWVPPGGQTPRQEL
ncbi:uncharacterized protein LOC126653702 [Mercurialis annua]|uniref:uncharacterized protein LOC126653702 n=1 Tax=Mercurialis annua TaxID=3986 RepID=UPI0024AF94BE|nr:uncharacterized protein LOC126653702 [Mercurialis annua]